MMSEKIGCAIMAVFQLAGLGAAIWWTVAQWNAGSNWCIVHFLVASTICAIVAHAISTGCIYLFIPGEKKSESQE
jgi:phage-related tail fiber protein